MLRVWLVKKISSWLLWAYSPVKNTDNEISIFVKCKGYNQDYIGYYSASLVALLVKSLPAMWQSLGQKDSLEKEMATHSSCLENSCLENSMDRGAWWVMSIRSQRVGHSWVTNTFTCQVHTLFCFFFPSPVLLRIKTDKLLGLIEPIFYLKGRDRVNKQ